MRKSCDPKEPMSLEERIFRQARIEDLFDDGVQTAPTLHEMVILNTSPNTRRSHRSLEDSGYANGVFDPTVDKDVNLMDSEMTVVKELTEGLVTVTMVGVRTGSNVLQATGTLPDPSSWTDHLHAPRHDQLRLPQAERPDPNHSQDDKMRHQRTSEWTPDDKN
ncbi:hypothetical protein FDENT_11261 [Fusarium denticulatum]|uniref:Uncharacterized protein n=1 Tax=Fusarium denticulatum TaxID=48507 RepID=A0A8H5TJB8_9HYPO|nr:hypothetical protein FDENT_11261 [Fusarium denticulatum]